MHDVVVGLTTAAGARHVLADVATLGPAFAFATAAGESGRAPGVPLARLLTAPGVLREQLDTAAAALGGAEDRVAASWLFGSMSARLVAPVVAAATVHRGLPVLTGADLHWRGPDAPGGPSWWLDPPRLVPWRDVDEVHGELVGPLAGIVSALRATVTASERQLWGEAATAVAKAARAVATLRPPAAEPARTLAADLLDRPPLSGTRATGRRSTCCLAYRVPGGRTCADCPLGPGRPGTAVLARRPRATHDDRRCEAPRRGPD